MLHCRVYCEKPHESTAMYKLSWRNVDAKRWSSWILSGKRSLVFNAQTERWTNTPFICSTEDYQNKWSYLQEKSDWKGITSERNLDLRIQSGVLAQIGTSVFKNIGNHYADHNIGEGDHLTSLLWLIIKKYTRIRLKSYGKDYTQIVAHKNIPSTRHLLTKSVIFSGQ